MTFKIIALIILLVVYILLNSKHLIVAAFGSASSVVSSARLYGFTGGRRCPTPSTSYHRDLNTIGSLDIIDPSVFGFISSDRYEHGLSSLRRNVVNSAQTTCGSHTSQNSVNYSLQVRETEKSHVMKFKSSSIC